MGIQLYFSKFFIDKEQLCKIPESDFDLNKNYGADVPIFLIVHYIEIIIEQILK
jgi:hypothetical protein